VVDELELRTMSGLGDVAIFRVT